MRDGEWSQRQKLNSATKAHIHGFELVHPNIYPIYDLLEHMKGTGPVKLQQQDVHDSEQKQDI